MALDKFKALIRTKAKELKANLSNSRIDAIAARLDKKFPDLTEDADHLEKIDDFNELQPFVDIAKDDDRIRTLEKAKGQPTKTENQEESNNEDTTKEPADDEAPAWAKTLIEKVSKLESEKVQGTMRTKVKDLLKDVPEIIYKGRPLPEKDEDLQGFVDEVTADYETYRQDQITKGLMTATPPGGGDGKAAQSKATEAAIKDWAASKGVEQKK